MNDIEGLHLKELEEVWLLMNKHTADLTKNQFVNALTQALKCGDFQRFICYDKGQAVIYLPYRKVQELEARIKELETALRAVKEAVASHVP